MIYSETRLPGAFVVDLEPIEDERGFFARAWAADELRLRGITAKTVQCNLSYNHRRGTLRGMHYQAPPYEEAKCIRCIRGALYDVIVDLRAGSPTYLQWFGIELTAENYRMLYVPEGFAHGFQTLTDKTEAFYQVSQFHKREAERGVRWDDPAFAIEWPDVNERTISPKDRSWPAFERR